MFNLNPIVELDVKRSRLTKGHHLNNLGTTRGTMPYIPSNKAWCWSMAFTINGHGSHFGHVTQLIFKLP